MRRPRFPSLLFPVALLALLPSGGALAQEAFAPPPGAASPSFPAPAGSIDEVVVTATRIPTPLRQTGGTAIVITRRQIEESGADSVSQLLREVPGVDVVQSGPSGGLTSVFLRGAKSEHTLVLIDGVEAHDPSSPGDAFDFSTLDLTGVERIEVLEGPQGVLYGSAAIGGVVSVTTRRGAGAPGGSVWLETGSFRTQRQGLSFSGGGDWNYSLSCGEKTTAGFSAAPSWAGNTERDGFHEQTLSARVGRGKAGGPGWDLAVRSARSQRDLDDWIFDPSSFSYAFADDPNYTSAGRELILSGQVRIEPSPAWRQTVAVSWNRTRREDSNPPDLKNPSDFSAAFEGEAGKAEWRSRIDLPAGHTLLLGLEARTEEARGDNGWGDTFDDRTRSEGAYLQGRFLLGEGISAAAGARADHYPGFGTEGTWDLSGSLLLPSLNTRLKGSLATGFKAPTLFQLHSLSLGNPELRPERSMGWEAGFEARLGEGGSSLEAAWFDNRFRDLISSPWPLPYINLERARSSGVEGRLTLKPLPGVAVDGAYTLTRTRDEKTGGELLRRPREKYDAALSLERPGGGSVRLVQTWVGKRQDFGGIGLPSYSVVSLRASRPVGRGLTATLRLENLLDRRYEEIAGYATAGRSGTLALKAEF